MSTSANDIETRSVVVEFDYPYPREKVWRAITEPDLVAAWLMPNDIKPVVGHTFTFKTQPAGSFDGLARCEVIACEPNELLSFTWVGGAKEMTGYGAYIDTVITIQLTRTAAGTHLRLEQSGFTPDVFPTWEIMSKGWLAIPARILKVIEESAG